jgi:hypothetical protein
MDCDNVNWLRMDTVRDLLISTVERRILQQKTMS